MSYKDLSKIVPNDVDGCNEEWLENYIEKDRIAKQEEADAEAAALQSKNDEQHSSTFREEPERIVEKKRRTVYIEKDDSEEIKKIIVKLQRYQESYDMLEMLGKPIPEKLKDKVIKALECEDVEKLRVVHLLLKSCVGGEFDSPPTQTQYILGTVNPMIETYGTKLGYDLTGFAQVASIKSRLSN